MHDMQLPQRAEKTLVFRKPVAFLPGPLRAIGRLVILIMLILYHGAAIVLHESIGKPDRKWVALRGRIWSRDLCRWLGIHVCTDGQIPGDGVLLLANHRSYIDIAAILNSVPCAMLAKAEVSRWPLLGLAARLGNSVFVERENKASRLASRQVLAGHLQKGLSVAVFPEGTTHSGPDILPFRPGMFFLAATEQLRLVPVAIHYDDPSDAWVGDETFIGHFLSCFAKKELTVRVGFGPVLTDTDAERLREQTEAWIRTRLIIWEGHRKEDS